MVWQLKSSRIVMLCNLVEDGRVCIMFFPFCDFSDTFLKLLISGWWLIVSSGCVCLLNCIRTCSGKGVLKFTLVRSKWFYLESNLELFVIMPAREAENLCAQFTFIMKVTRVLASWTEGGKVFQAVEPTTGKERSPIQIQVRETDNSIVLEDLNRLWSAWEKIVATRTDYLYLFASPLSCVACYDEHGMLMSKSLFVGR